MVQVACVRDCRGRDHVVQVPAHAGTRRGQGEITHAAKMQKVSGKSCVSLWCAPVTSLPDSARLAAPTPLVASEPAPLFVESGRASDFSRALAPRRTCAPVGVWVAVDVIGRPSTRNDLKDVWPGHGSWRLCWVGVDSGSQGATQPRGRPLTAPGCAATTRLARHSDAAMHTSVN